jgi:hypothetical protein
LALFEIGNDGLIPFRALHGGVELYESEIEDLVWDNVGELAGEALFRIKRQAILPGGGRPDIVALDRGARVTVIEIKRDVDRGQLAQCLEYAGWARSATLDDLAGMYYRGTEAFFSDWQEFTESDSPVVINRSPRLVLVARDFHGRTESAFEFLVENGLPVRLIRVALYEDQQGRRFLDVEGEFEAEPPGEDGHGAPSHPPAGTGLRVSDLLDRGILQAGEELVWDRPRVGQHYTARLTENGAIELEDGRRFWSPSGAAVEAAGIASYDGWYAWRVPRLDGASLNDLRMRMASEASDTD